MKPTGAPRFTRYEVLGFGVANGAPALRIDRMGPDNYWFGARPQILLDRRGAGVDGMIARVRDAVGSYPYPNRYRPWPGPNSNTFLAHIDRQVPDLAIQLPSNAVGKDFLPGGRVVASPRIRAPMPSSRNRRARRWSAPNRAATVAAGYPGARAAGREKMA